MFTLRKTFTFEAAHRLPAHDGKCARLHGHSWRLTVEVRGPALATAGPKAGMLVDYGDLKALAQPLVDEHLDHHYLNETLPALGEPTSERVAQWAHAALNARAEVAGWRWRVHAVEVDETCTSACRYEVP
jgi:6-pyruvoyltetrahydropterin/6-carboxytetrahydropterin synthase